jgi:hypothetical protein
MQRLYSLLTAFLLLTGAGTLSAAGPEEIERGVSSDQLPSAEKGERAPVPQYALAALCALSLLVIVCMPSRKSHT